MPGDGRGDLPEEPGGTAQFLVAVVQAGDEQGGHLDPEAQLVAEADGVEHRLQPGLAHLAVEGVRVGLEVDVDRVQPGGQVPGRLGAQVAVADEHVADTPPVGQQAAVAGELVEHGGLDVRIADACAAAAFRLANHLLRAADRTVDPPLLQVRVLGDLVVLAVQALKIAAHGGDGVGAAPGQEMKERLLLDGVDMARHQPAVHQAVQSPLPVFPYPAQAAAAGRNVAVVAAQVADHRPVLHPLVEHCLVHASSSPVAAGRDQADSRLTCGSWPRFSPGFWPSAENGCGPPRQSG